MDLVELGFSVDTRGIEQGINKLDKLEASEKKVGVEAKKSGGLIAKSFEEATTAIDKNGNSIAAADVAMGRFVDSAGKTREANGRFVQGLSETDKMMGKVSKSGTGLTNVFGNMQNKVVGLIAGIGVAGLTLATKDYQKALAQVSTLVDTTTFSMSELSDEALRQSVQFGTMPTDNAKAFYSAISAGANTAEKATDALTAANKLAIGGVTTNQVAIDGLTSVMNAYAGSAGSFGDITDSMFIALKAGKTTIDKMSASIGDLAPIASEAGASFDEVMAATAALTKGGVRTSTAMDGLRAIMVAVIKPSSEAEKMAKNLGLEFSAAALKSKGLAGFLEDLAKKTGGSTEKLAELFGGVEALTPVLALTGSASKTFADTLTEMKDKAGATDAAFNKMTQTADFQANRVKAGLTAAWVSFSQGALDSSVPALTALADGIQSVTFYVKEITIALTALALFMARNMIASGVSLIANQSLVALSLARTNMQALAQVPSMGKAAVAMNIATGAARGLAGVMALIGGPVGLFVIAAASAFAYKDEIRELTSGVKMSKEQEEARVKVLSDVKRLSEEATGATKELSASKRKDAEASYQASQAELARLKTLTAASRQRFEAAKAAEASEKAQGLSARYRSTENLEAATMAAKNANAEYQAQLDLVREIDKELQNFGKQRVTIQGVNVESGVTSGTLKTPKVGTVDQAAKDAQKALQSIRTEQEKYNDSLAQYGGWLKTGKIDTAEYNKLKLAATAILEKANATAKKAIEKAKEVKSVTVELTEAQKAAKDLITSTITPYEKYKSTSEKILALKGQEGITQEIINRGLDDARQEYLRTDETMLKLAKTKADNLIKSEAQKEATAKATQANKLAQEVLGKTDEQIRALTLSYKEGYTVELANSQARAEFAKKANDKLRVSQAETTAQNKRDADELAKKNEVARVATELASGIEDIYKKSLANGTMSQITRQVEELSLVTSGKYSESQAKSISTNKALVATYKDIVTALSAIKDPTNSLTVELDKLKQQWIDGKISADDYYDSIGDAVEKSKELVKDAKKVSEDLEKNTKQLSVNLVDAINETLLGGDFRSLGEKLNDIFADDVFGPILTGSLKSFGTLFSNSLKGLTNSISGTLGGGDIFADVGKGLSSLLSNTSVKESFAKLDFSGALDEALGNSGIGSTIGSAIGSIWGPIGSSIGSALGSIAESAFGGSTYTKDAGVELGYSGIEGFYGSNFEEKRKKKSLWRGTERWTEYSELDSEIGESINQYFDTVDSAMATQAALFGKDAEELLRDFVVSATKFSGEDIGAQVQEWAEQTTAEMYEIIFADSLGQFQQTGEEMSDTVTRLLVEIDSVISGLGQMGVYFNTTTKNLAIVADGLVQAAGSLDVLKTNMQSYYDVVFTADEKVALKQKAAKKEIDLFNESLGLTGSSAIDTVEELKAYVDSQSLFSESGQEAIVSAYALAASIATYSGTAEEAAEETAVLAAEVEALGSAADQSLNLISTLADELYGSIDQRYATELARYDALKDGANDLRDAVIGFTDSVSGTQDTLADSQRNYNDLLAQAQSGDTSVIPGLMVAADTLRNALSENYAGGSQSTSGNSLISGQLEQVASALDLRAGSAPVDPSDTVDRTSLAQELASEIAALGLAQDTSVFDLMNANGIYLSDLAADFGVDVNNLNADTSEGLKELASSLGIDITELNTDTASELRSLASGLGVDFFSLSESIGFDISAMTESFGVDMSELLDSNNIGASLIYSAINGASESANDVAMSIVDGISAQASSGDLIPYLSAIESANNYDSLTSAVESLLDSNSSGLSALLSGFNVDLNTLNSDTLNGLSNLAEALSTDSISLGQTLGLTLDELSGALISELSSQSSSLPADIQSGLAPYLSAIESANDSTSLINAVSDTSRYFDTLSDDVRSQLNGDLNWLADIVRSQDRQTRAVLLDNNLLQHGLISIFDSGLLDLANTLNVDFIDLAEALGVDLDILGDQVAAIGLDGLDLASDIGRQLSPYLRDIQDANDSTSLESAINSVAGFIGSLPSEIRSELNEKLSEIVNTNYLINESVNGIDLDTDFYSNNTDSLPDNIISYTEVESALKTWGSDFFDNLVIQDFSTDELKEVSSLLADVILNEFSGTNRIASLADTQQEATNIIRSLNNLRQADSVNEIETILVNSGIDGISGQMRDDEVEMLGILRGIINNSNIASYDVGSDYIQSDQIAQIHNGEAIFTAAQSSGLRDSVTSIMSRIANEPQQSVQPTTVNLMQAKTDKSDDLMQKMLDELKATKAEIKEMKDDQKVVSREINKNVKESSRTLDRWETIGLPLERTE